MTGIANETPSATRAMRDDIARAVSALRAGEAVAFPTDTVFGVGVSVEHAASPQVIYDIKQREAGKPVAWLVGGVDDLARYGKDVPDRVLELAREHWPGALTLVVNASDAVPPAFRSREGTIGLRAPASDIALELIAALGCPIATSSANLSGAPAPRTRADLDPALVARVAAVVGDAVAGDPGASRTAAPADASGTPSTVLDCTGSEPTIIRAGSLADAITHRIR